MVRQQALLLNADYQPIKVIPWEKAVLLLLDERAELVEAYAERFVHSVSAAIPWPAVLRLVAYVDGRPRMRFSRQNVLARDHYRCAYCGIAPVRKNGRPKLEALTLDHVVPRAQSRGGKVRLLSGLVVGVTCWENLVTACVDCNLRKADRTPNQAGMPLLQQPRKPNPIDVLRIHLRRERIPDEWTAYLPEGAKAWGGYWTDELDQD